MLTVQAAVHIPGTPQYASDFPTQICLEIIAYETLLHLSRFYTMSLNGATCLRCVLSGSVALFSHLSCVCLSDIKSPCFPENLMEILPRPLSGPSIDT